MFENISDAVMMTFIICTSFVVMVLFGGSKDRKNKDKQSEVEDDK